jgi:hypothetical protein
MHTDDASALIVDDTTFHKSLNVRREDDTTVDIDENLLVEL